MISTRYLVYSFALAALIDSGQVSSQQTHLVIDELRFVDHISANLIEQDALVEKESGSGEVYRLSPEEYEAFKDEPVYGTAEPIHHSPFNPEANGPYPKGADLGVTLKEWLAGRGTGTYTCSNGQGELQVTFEKLVPNGLYTMWYAFAGKAHMGCPDCPFSTIDFPVGDIDGSQATFNADAQGNARYEATFEPCLQLSGERLAAMLAIAYHSDGKSYGPHPGKFGKATHVQLFTMMPEQNSWRTKPQQSE